MEEEERIQSQEDFSRESPPLVVQQGWQSTADARGCINALLKRNKRKYFGLLEKPVFEQYGKPIPVLFKRLFLVGKTGVGKTSTIHKLTGRDIPPVHEETLGIQTNTTYWPLKLASPHKTLIVKLELWDAGERAMSKFDHILPTCKQATDGILFLFSYADRHSWETLPQLFTSVLGGLPTPDTLNIVIGTHADCSHREVTDAEVERFQRRFRIISLPIANVNSKRLASDPSFPDGRAGIVEITPFMNALTEVILAYEKRQTLLQYAASGYQPSQSESGLTPIVSLLNSLSPDTESPSQ